MDSPQREQYESILMTLVNHAWDQEVRWPQIEAWLKNFSGKILSKEDEELYALFILSRFMFFCRRLVREMLKSLYRDHFESPLVQRIRRHLRNTTNIELIRKLYSQELISTRFVGAGNPAESGAHLLYYFRQVNYLPKNLFVDIGSAFAPTLDRRKEKIKFLPLEPNVTRYVFFDDLVGSGRQAKSYLSNYLKKIRTSNPDLDLRFMSLFATTKGLNKLNSKELFDGKAMTLFELDETYKAFEKTSRYFSSSPEWFEINKLLDVVRGYGKELKPGYPLGYRNGQLLLAFSHNTPNNAPPIFWDEGHAIPWFPIFIRYDKIYGGKP